MFKDKTLATFSRQLFTGIASILVTGILLFLYSYFSNKIGWTWIDGSKYEFWFFPLMAATLAVPFTIFGVQKEQFDRALEPTEVFESTMLMFTIAGILIIVILQGFVTLFLLQQLWLGLITLILNCLFFSILALSVATTLSLSVSSSEFDRKQHREDISNRSALNACNQGRLPYRQKIYLLGESTLSFMFFLFCMGILFVIATVPGSQSGIILMGIISIIPLLAMVSFIKMLIAPNLMTVRDSITKSIDEQKGYRYRITHHQIYCDGRLFKTDPFIWYNVTANKKYKFWYIPSLSLKHQGKIIAYQSLETHQNKFKPTSITHPTIETSEIFHFEEQTDMDLKGQLQQSRTNTIIKLVGIMGGMILSILLWRKKKN